MDKPRIAILTSLTDFSLAYSLNGVILDQCRMLKRAGYDFNLLCLKNFNMKEHDAQKLAEEFPVRFILPQTQLHDYQVDEPAKDPHKDKHGRLILGFDQQVRVHLEGDKERGTIGYKEALKDYDVIITHDLMFISSFLVQNKAVRECIKLYPEKTWIHWVHSAASIRPGNVCYPSELRYSKAPNSIYVYLNNKDKHKYALMIQTQDKDIQVVYNSKDIRDVWRFNNLSCDIIDRYDLMDHEILQVYPFSTPRWKDKGVRQLMRIFGAWKKAKVKSKLVLINAHCNSKKDLIHVDSMEAYAEVCGLKLDEDVILTSRYSDEKEPDASYQIRKLRYSVPFQTVKELMMLSNMFVFPTVGECCSLIQAEASMSGKFMVINRDFPSLMEFCTNNVLHFEFTVNDPDINPAYYDCVAMEILANFRSESVIVNRTQAITKTYNRDWIFKNQLEPLLYKGETGRRKFRKKRREIVPPKRPRLLTSTETDQPIVIEAKEVEQKTRKREGTNYADPWPGMECPIFGQCSTDQKKECYDQAGHCLMLDEIDHARRQQEKDLKEAKSGR